MENIRERTLNEECQKLHDEVVKLCRILVIQPLTPVLIWLNKKLEKIDVFIKNL